MRLLKRALVIAVLAICCLPLAAQTDAYGGMNGLSCTPLTNWYFAKTSNNNWTACTPAGHGMFVRSVNNVDRTNSPNDDLGGNYSARVYAKYGNSYATWGEMTNQRLKAWGFNAIGPWWAWEVTPWASPPVTTKLPILLVERPAFYGWTNTFSYLTEPLKEMWFGRPASYNTNYGVNADTSRWADFYDPKLFTELQGELETSDSSRIEYKIRNSPDKAYLMAINVEDSDDTHPFGNGPDFDTTPSGHHTPNAGWGVLVMSPLQAANSNVHDGIGELYPTPKVWTKQALADQLATQYGTVAALNTAWSTSSYYTTFGTSGKCVGWTLSFSCGSTAAADAISSGTGSKTLGNANISKHSLGIFADGTLVGGDMGDGSTGTLWGPSLAGTINYAAGTMNLTAAPAGTLTVKYVSNGWGYGTGLMDEDGRHAWVGADAVSLTDSNATVKVDINQFLYQMSYDYFTGTKAKVKAVTAFPWVMYGGPYTMGTWSAPPRAEVLKAAAAAGLDYIVMGGQTSLTNSMLTFVGANYGDHPMIEGQYRTANPNSALWNYSDSGVGGFATQATRGADFQANVAAMPTRSGSQGYKNYAGYVWWELHDNWGEHLNWGLVSYSDNAYDGHEDVAGSVSCQGPTAPYTCGGEASGHAPYGDVITSVTATNAAINTALTSSQAPQAPQYNSGFWLGIP